MAIADTSALLAAAHEYARYGWRLVPLHSIKPDGHCTCNRGEQCGVGGRGKHPRVTEWHKKASCEAETIDHWWSQLWPEANIGVKLGPESGIIDVECDSPEAERALSELFDHDFPITPTWLAHRGKHRLFRYSDAIPGAASKAVVKFHGIEFRIGGGGNGAQSVLPPSVHPSGAQYRWLIDPATVDVALLPASVIERLRAESGEQRAGGKIDWAEIVRDGVTEGNRNQAAAQLIGRMLADLADPFDNSAVRRQFELALAWNERNHPPLADDEIQKIFNSILRRHREHTANDEYQTALEKYVPIAAQPSITTQPESTPAQPATVRPEPASTTATASGWRLVCVLSKPISYRLYSPLWAAKNDGYLLLSTDDLMNADRVRREAMEQANTWIDPDFKNVWNGKKGAKGLAAKLVDTQEYENATAEEHRDIAILMHLHGEISRALVVRADDEGSAQPSSIGVSKLPNGDVAMLFNDLLTTLARSDDRITRVELSRMLTRIGATKRWFGTRAGGRRYVMLTKTQVESLAETIHGYD